MPHATPQGPPKSLCVNPIIKQESAPTMLGLC